MYLIRKGWENAAGKIYKDGSFVPFKKDFEFEEEWNSKEQVNVFYAQNQYKDIDKPVLVDDIAKTRMTNGNQCVFGTYENVSGKRALMYIKGPLKGREITDISVYETLYDDLCDGTENVILFDDHFEWNRDLYMYVTNLKHSFINPVLMNNVIHETEWSDHTTRNGIDFISARIEPIGNRLHKGNYIIFYDTRAYLFNIESPKKIEEIERFISELKNDRYVHCENNRYYETVVYFGTDQEEIKIEGLTDAFSCI